MGRSRPHRPWRAEGSQPGIKTSSFSGVQKRQPHGPLRKCFLKLEMIER